MKAADATLWTVTLPEAASESDLQLLGAEERSRADRYRRVEGRTSFAIGRSALRRVLQAGYFKPGTSIREAFFLTAEKGPR